MAAVDAVALLAVVSALAFLATPYVRMVAAEVGGLVSDLDAAGVSSYYAPFAAAGAGAAIAAVAGVVAWDAVGHRARRCGKPRCRGLRKAVEFDIQLETEECVRGQQQRLLPLPGGRAALLAAAGARPVQLGDAHRELEAELRKMAPPNGRTVLIFRSPCGCPKGRMEVWGAKKVRRIKKLAGPKFCFPRVPGDGFSDGIRMNFFDAICAGELAGEGQPNPSPPT
uniref:Ribosomal protein L34e superfamily protein n=1 Tax=Oryza punctata TaxID=4537 RepID=A0A0E0L421_ORYPU